MFGDYYLWAQELSVAHHTMCTHYIVWAHHTVISERGSLGGRGTPLLGQVRPEMEIRWLIILRLKFINHLKRLKILAREEALSKFKSHEAEPGFVCCA